MFPSLLQSKDGLLLWQIHHYTYRIEDKRYNWTQDLSTNYESAKDVYERNLSEREI